MDWPSFLLGGYLMPALTILAASLLHGAKDGLGASEILAAFMFAACWPVAILKPEDPK